MIKQIVKFAVIFFIAIFLVACSKCKAKFGGVKDDSHIKSEEEKALILPKKLAPKRSGCSCRKRGVRRNDIPEVLNVNKNIDKPVNAKPPGF